MIFVCANIIFAYKVGLDLGLLHWTNISLTPHNQRFYANVRDLEYVICY